MLVALPQNSKLRLKEFVNAGSADVLVRNACVAREDFRGNSRPLIVRATRSVRTRTSALPAWGNFITFEAKPVLVVDNFDGLTICPVPEGPNVYRTSIGKVVKAPEERNILFSKHIPLLQSGKNLAAT